MPSIRYIALASLMVSAINLHAMEEETLLIAGDNTLSTETIARLAVAQCHSLELEKKSRDEKAQKDEFNQRLEQLRDERNKINIKPGTHNGMIGSSIGPC